MIASHSLRPCHNFKQTLPRTVSNINFYSHYDRCCLLHCLYLQHISKYNLGWTQDEGEAEWGFYESGAFYCFCSLLAMCVMCPQIEHRRRQLYLLFISTGAFHPNVVFVSLAPQMPRTSSLWTWRRTWTPNSLLMMAETRYWEGMNKNIRSRHVESSLQVALAGNEHLREFNDP